MLKEKLVIKELRVGVNGKHIIDGLCLRVGKGEVHAVMGPNGSGKSTLAQAIMGNPEYEVEGSIIFEDQDISNADVSRRAELGFFLSFQHPLEISGVNITSFLRMIYNKRFTTSITSVKFRSLLEEKMKIIDMKPEFADRYLNEGFSGGEKKKMEILQMLVMEPKLIILDEVDSGLDIDALKSVVNGINLLRRKTPETAFIIITHHARILHHVKPDFVHVMRDGKIIKSGGFEIAQSLEETGYKEFGPEESRNPVDK